MSSRMNTATIDAAWKDTHGLERVLRKRGIGAELSDNEKATAWAQQQPWWSRVVRTKCDARYWIWFCEPEGGR